MKTSETKQPPASAPISRAPRSDGDNTRALILDVAGQLFAQLGYESVTSKMICEHAKVNLAAVNYHFGSRDGLYTAVLNHVHEQLISSNALQQFAQAPLDARVKVALMIQAIVNQYDTQDWRMQFYLREALTCRDLFFEVFQTSIIPKAQQVWHILAQAAHIPADDPRIPHVFITTFTPCIAPMIINPRVIHSVFGRAGVDKDRHIQVVTAMVLAGLQQLNI